jgi:magnesium-transporting ATPase (P-type)
MSSTSPPPEPRWAYRHSVEAVVAALASDAERGLGQAEARARLERHGRNELTAERPVPAWRKFLGQFRDVLVILLLIATKPGATLSPRASEVTPSYPFWGLSGEVEVGVEGIGRIG